MNLAPQKPWLLNMIWFFLGFFMSPLILALLVVRVHS